MKHLHLPVSEDTHHALRLAAQQSGVPATTLAREAVERWLHDWQQARLDAELDAYIAAEAGGPGDLDPVLEDAGVEHLLATR